MKNRAVTLLLCLMLAALSILRLSGLGGRQYTVNGGRF